MFYHSSRIYIAKYNITQCTHTYIHTYIHIYIYIYIYIYIERERERESLGEEDDVVISKYYEMYVLNFGKFIDH